MAEDSYVETETTGWLGRIKSAVAGMVFSPIIIIGAVILLGWNERRAIRTATALNEGQRALVSAAADTVNPANEGKLIYLSGQATTDETLSDDLFGVSLNALALHRVAKTYQWKETEKSSSKKNLGGSETKQTEYKYEKVWSESLIDSSDFKKRDGHQNPERLRFESAQYYADDATLGAYQLSRDLVSKIDGATALNVGEDELENVDSDEVGDVALSDGGYYLGRDPKNPQIGDVRVTFEALRPTTVSVVAGQTGRTLGQFATSNGETLALVKQGVHSSAVLFEDARSENAILTWILRFVGTLLMVIGFAMLMSILSVLADVIPFLGSLVGAGTGLLAMAFGIVLSGVVIAISWIAFRPLVGGSLLLSVALLAFFFSKRISARKAQAAVAA